MPTQIEEGGYQAQSNPRTVEQFQQPRMALDELFFRRKDEEAVKEKAGSNYRRYELADWDYPTAPRSLSN